MIKKRLTGSRRIAVNTAISYGRTLISIVFVLFSSRWVLEELGTVDFGLSSLIGTILSIVLFLNTVLANGDARFFALGIGQNDQIELNKVFNTILSLHIVLPFILTVFGLLAGEFVMRHYLVIPPERLHATIIVFRITMFVSFFTMMTVPFSTLFVAYQNILESSLFTLLHTFLMFISAYALRFLPNTLDKLIIYSIMSSTASVIVTVIVVAISCRKYKCTKVRRKFFFDKKLSLDVLRYSFWNMMGDFGHLIRTQGTSIIVNLFFGPTGNAALGIANQVAMQSANLTNAMHASTSPEIYRRAGEGNLQSAMTLANFTSKIGVLLIWAVGVPVLFNLDDLLRLWLVNVPTGTKVLCECFIFMFVVEKLTIGQLTYLNAIGKVALVKVLILLFYSSALIFPFCGLMQLGIAGIGVACILSMFLSRCSILYCIRKYADFDLLAYLKSTVVPVLVVVIILYAFILLNVVLHSVSIMGLALNGAVVFLLTTFASMFLLFNQKERSQIIHLVINKI